MNRSDSDLMAVSLQEAGYQPAASVQEADVVVYNTCSVRQHAEDRVTARIASNRHKIHKKEGIIIVAGCMAQRLGSKLIDDGLADMVIGPYQSPRVGGILTEALQKAGGAGSLGKLPPHNLLFTSQSENDFEGRLHPDILSAHKSGTWHEWVTITHGCENFCAYCIVPFVRGKLISFPSGEILDHIRKITSEGITEISLLGQNVNQYGQDSDDIPFYRLLEKTAQIKGIERLNFLTSHPKDFSREIISVIRDNENMSRSVHLPLQSGSDPVLKKMNRQYTMNHYFGIVEALEQNLDNFSLSTDLIVGFPGETEEHYRETLSAVEQIRFDDAFMYAYSPRSGTPAALLEESLTREEKIARLNGLISLQRKISVEKLEARIDKIERMIPEKLSRHSSREIMGRTFLNHPVVVPGTADDTGKVISVQVTGINGSTLQAEKI